MGYPCDYNCNELPDHVQLQCNLWKKGGISALGVLECDHDIADFESLQDLQDAVTAGKLHWISGSGIKGAFPLASPIEIENPSACGAENVLDGFTMKIDFTDANVAEENDAFFAALNGRSTRLLWYECSTNTLMFVSETVTWTVMPAEVPFKITEIQKYTGSATWIANKNSFPIRFVAPAGLFT